MTTPLMTAEHARAMLELVGPGNHGGRARELLDAYRTVVALHEMLAGRDRPPTPDEVRAHKGTLWLHSDGDVWSLDAYGDRYDASVSVGGMFQAREMPTSGRWWAWCGAICAWPEVTK